MMKRSYGWSRYYSRAGILVEVSGLITPRYHNFQKSQIPQNEMGYDVIRLSTKKVDEPGHRICMKRSESYNG